MDIVNIMNKIIRDSIAIIFGLVMAFNPSWSEFKFGVSYPYNLVVAFLYETIFCLLLVKHIKEYHNSKIK